MASGVSRRSGFSAAAREDRRRFAAWLRTRPRPGLTNAQLLEKYPPGDGPPPDASVNHDLEPPRHG